MSDTHEPMRRHLKLWCRRTCRLEQKQGVQHRGHRKGTKGRTLRSWRVGR